ncbi:ATP-dependent protease LonB [Heliorestis acidaminivorans]|uniref:endopeptidase La n=1 Tax=Heliorestis acidaminivorans TaxID=553427 RepID=A0A6I0F5L0_9FIRM|nr:ATP-dependent protease LonB [Heliorestis acidaminivorans]KAB2952589.1 ATP-dependent protease LonB [Heliorestis acidaminivorans]
MSFSSSLNWFLGLLQIFFIIIIGTYFWHLLRNQQSNKSAVERESRKELDRLQLLRSISLSEPLSEKTRPSNFSEIVGQNEGIKALKAALCGPNPQHVLVYGPPGVGKTAAARLVLQEAITNPLSPFRDDAKFIEIDGATARFDERGIADPLIGSVHDPIYQGAGAMGMAGIPQPKQGAVTKAHGGILFIDEIGELHPIQINKMLKVLEDRKVILESAYYSSEDNNIPGHIHDIFQNGLPADFRLVGATTRLPQEIPPAIRSRCLEIYFRSLNGEEIAIIANGAAEKMSMKLPEEAVKVIQEYATNGREAVNIVQIAAGISLSSGKNELAIEDIEWVVHSGQYNRRPDRKVPTEPQIGLVNGLAVTGPSTGVLMEIEATVISAKKGKGLITVTGIVDEEELGGMGGRKIKRRSLVKTSVDNVVTALRCKTDIEPRDWDIHINFPGGTPIDGPSAGIAMATAIYSAIKAVPVHHKVAMTGEISVRGHVKPIGGVLAKIEAARIAGAERVLIPKENWLESFKMIETPKVIPLSTLEQVFTEALLDTAEDSKEEIMESYELIPATAFGAVAGDSIEERSTL